jgi:hypothetical protein
MKGGIKMTKLIQYRFLIVALLTLVVLAISAVHGSVVFADGALD